MPSSSRFNFAVGVTVTILTTTGIFIGELVDETGISTNNHTDSNTTNTNNFLVVRLTTATAPFTAGQLVRININRIVALG